jgi:hypothetical protein
LRVIFAVAGLLLGVLAASASVRAESSKDDWFDEECVPKAVQRSCVPKLKQGGWTLKYQTVSPADLVDVGWLVEVWVKGSDALVCELKTGRGVPRSNGCYSLSEVAK